MAIAPLIVRITALGAAALGRAAAAFRAFGASVSSSARAAAGRAGPAFARLAAVLRAVASAALRAAAAIGGPLRRALIAASRAAGNLTQRLGRFVLRWGAIIAALLPLIFPLANAFANLLPLVMHLAPAAIAAGASLLVLKLGFEGVGDAMSAGLEGDIEEYRKALKKLSPQAREFVKHLVMVAPAWRDLRRLIQEKLFHGLSLEVENTSNALGRIAVTWLPKIASLFDNFFFAVMKGMQSKEFARQMDVIMEGVSDFIFGALHAIRMLGRAFLDIAEVAAPSFGELGSSIGTAADKFAGWIREMKDNGTLKRWLDQAKETFNQLIDIGREAGRVLSAIFKGTDEQGFLEGIKNSLKELADFLHGDDGQQMLNDISMIANGMANLIRIIGDVVRWFQEGLDLLRNLFSDTESDVVPLANSIGAAISGIANAFNWIGTVSAKLAGFVTAVQNAARGINAALNSIKTVVNIDIVTRHSTQGYIKPITGTSGGGGGGAKVRARGGPVTRGMPYIVGEKRPELFVPNQSGRILPSVPTGSGGGGGTWSGRMTGLDALFYRWFQESVRSGRLKLT